MKEQLNLVPPKDEDLLGSIHRIVCALDYLKKEAEKTEAEDIIDIVDSALKMSTAAYTVMCRYSLVSKLENFNDVH